MQILGSPIILMIAMFLIMYFIVIRPQKKQQKEFEEMLANLKKGDKILTRGGIYAVIIDFVGKDKQKVLLDAGNGTKFQISRSYIASQIDAKIEKKEATKK
mgnify:FL=1|tara:strand:+ start:295 stop:597 length:303 start_codon:yes stop_codon:yes gene_type:complete